MLGANRASATKGRVDAPECGSCCGHYFTASARQIGSTTDLLTSALQLYYSTIDGFQAHCGETSTQCLTEWCLLYVSFCFLFNDALNSFYLWLYGIRHMVNKDHSDSKRGNLLPTHGLLLLISSKGSFI